ncbi:hypothetical protein MY3296_009165 [Beauveria thailandica]
MTQGYLRHPITLNLNTSTFIRIIPLRPKNRGGL